MRSTMPKCFFVLTTRNPTDIKIHNLKGEDVNYSCLKWSNFRETKNILFYIRKLGRLILLDNFKFFLLAFTSKKREAK